MLNNKTRIQKKYVYVCSCIARFMRVWPWIVMYTYSILPQEHNGMIESGWKIKFEFANFVKKLRNLGLLQEARVSSLVFVNVLGIYRARGWSKKNEKRYALECK